jgi:hypothetical protein
MTLNDVKRIIKLLGRKGAIAGLCASEIRIDLFRSLALKSKLDVNYNAPYSDLIEEMVDILSKNNLKNTDDLLRMSYEELVQYFSDASPSNEDLMKIMKELNYKVSAEDKKHLRRFVARQISETALFANVASRSGDPRRK